MEENLKLRLFKIIFDELNLQEIENEFIEAGVPQKEIISIDGKDPISRYFFLRNDIYLGRLDAGEFKRIEQLANSGARRDLRELDEFLSDNRFRLLMPETSARYLYWDRSDLSHMAPADAVVIAFHTLRYDYDSSRAWERNWPLVNYRLNYIQEVSSKKVGYKVAVLEFDETPISFDGYKEAVWF